MSEAGDDILKELRTIRKMLERISACFDEQYAEVQAQRRRTRFEELQAMLTGPRRRIYPLVFDARRLSQAQIAAEAETSQPTVSRFVSALLEADLIEQAADASGRVVYKDKFRLAPLLEAEHGSDE